MIAVGVDTHKDRHIAVVLDQIGQLLGEISISASLTGYRELDAWVTAQVGEHGEIVFGIEGAGSWGAGLCEFLQAQGRTVLEVERPRKSERRAGSQTGSTRSRPPSAFSRARGPLPRVSRAFVVLWPRC
jgi:transposase